MDSFTVLVTARIPEPGIQLLKERGYRVEVLNEEDEQLEHLIFTKIKNADALLPLLSHKVDRRLIDRAPRLKVIANYAVGYNNIDVAYAGSKGIVVTNTPDILTPATADLTWALILSVAKRIVEGDALVRAGKFKGWRPKLLLGGDVTGKTLGIVGAGRIGQAVGKRALGFNMSLLYVGPHAKPDFERDTGAKRVDLTTLLAESDYITIHCPLTEETYHLLNAGNMNRIKRGAYLINTARGQVVEEKALVSLLKSGHMAGAGLDVYEFEPAVSEELLNMKNVVLLPHIGSATVETRNEMSRMAARNIISVLEEGKAIHPVN